MFIKLIYLFIWLISFGFMNLWAVPFEGDVIYSIKGEGAMMSVENSMTFYLKGSKVRAVPHQNASYTVADYDAHTMAIVKPLYKTYMNVPWTIKNNKNLKDWSFIRSDGTQNILGRTCQKWIYKKKNETVVVWAAEGIGNFKGIGETYTWAAVLNKKNLFPLKIETIQTTVFGTNDSTMEAMKLEPKALDDAFFGVSSDYQITVR